MKFKNPEKVGYLQECCNKYGDFKICTRKPDGSWTKHFSVLYCWSNLEVEGWRLDEANNRTAFPCELILDLDLNPKETSEELKVRVKSIIQELKEENDKFKVYFSGSKGFHIYIIIPGLEKYNQQIKNYTASSLGVDVQVVGKNHMIALEHCPHWKTGNIKQEVEL